MTVIMINKPDPIEPFLCLISKLWVNKCGPSELFPDISIPNTKSPLCKKVTEVALKRSHALQIFMLGLEAAFAKTCQFNSIYKE